MVVKNRRFKNHIKTIAPLAIFTALGLAFIPCASGSEPIENVTETPAPSPQEILEEQHQSAVNLARDGQLKEALSILAQLHKENPSEIKIFEILDIFFSAIRGFLFFNQWE